MTIFILLSLIGGYFLFSRVPLGHITNWFGSRNPYDRIVHFASGLLLTYPLYELLTKNSTLKRGMGAYIIPFFIIAGIAGAYEILEWAGGVLSEHTFSNLQMSMQGDAFDAQKDMLMACIGSVSTLIILKISNQKSK